GRISGRGRHTAYWPRGCSHRRVATMNGGYPTDTTGAKPGHAHDPPDVNWLRLKRLIIGNEQKRLARLEERLNSPEIQADEMASILPKAIARGLEKNPLGVSAALLLVIGPAIRNAISTAFQELLRNLDRLLQKSLSPIAWQWRMEALRTGKPFAEVVMLHSLRYRVEQLFLIDRRTSLVIKHIQAPWACGQDPDLIAAMLSAIQDFVS